MNKGSKIAVTILLITGFFIIAIFLTAAGTSKTFVGLLALGLFFGIRTMWKKPQDEPNDNSEVKLNKKKSDNKDITRNK
jgi:hypothetical protein